MIEITKKVYLPNNALREGVSIYFDAFMPDANKLIFQPCISIVNNGDSKFVFTFYNWVVPIHAVKCDISSISVFEALKHENKETTEKELLDLIFSTTIDRITIYAGKQVKFPECELTFKGGFQARSHEEYDKKLETLLVF